MTQTKTKKALAMSVLSMMLCVAMLVGMTFAWFTDTASTSVNKIQAGNLDVELLMYENGEYVNISKEPAPIFGSENSTVAQNNNLDTLWEPGKTQVAYLAIKNEGNLALKYKVALNVTNPADGKDLYKVMQYAIAPNAKGSDTSVPAWTSGSSVAVGTQIVSDDPVELKVGATHYFALLVHMDEQAGNDYQNGKVEFDLKVLATQLASESDSYGNDYDKNAQYPDINYANASDQESFADAISDSQTSEKPSYIEVSGNNLSLDSSTAIGSDTTLAGKGIDNTTLNAKNAKIAKDDVTIKDMTINGTGSAGTGGTLNINGNNTTIENVNYEGDGKIAITVSTGAKNTGTVFKNTKITNAFRGIQFWSLSGDSVIDNCILDVAGYTFNIDATVTDSTLTIKDSTLNGWTSYTSGIKLVSFENCKLGLKAYQYLRPYSETKITDCEFTSADYQMNAGGSDAYTITLTNCTKNGTKITAENVKDLLLDMDDWNTNATLIVDGTTVTLS